MFPKTRDEKRAFLNIAGLFATLFKHDWARWYSEAENARVEVIGKEFPVKEWLKTYAAEQIANDQTAYQ